MRQRGGAYNMQQTYNVQDMEEDETEEYSNTSTFDLFQEDPAGFFLTT